MQIGFIGAGSMASALARGLGEPALVSARHRDRAAALADEIGGEAVASNAELAERADVVVLAHKPAQLEEVATEAAGHARAVASMVAGVPVARLEELYPGVPIYRFMPNIPVEVGRGVLCYAPGSMAAAGPVEELLALFGRVGAVVELDEGLIDAATALMGSGPAFVALVVEAMAAAGVRHGLEPRQATRLVVETMAGSAAYLDANDLDADELRRRVATPGGLTEKGLDVLERSGLRSSFDQAIDLVVESAAA